MRGIIFEWFFPLRFLAYPGPGLFAELSKMKKGTKGSRYLAWTANALLLLVLVHPIFHEYQDLAHSELFSSLNHIESLHPEDLSITRDEHRYTGDMVISTQPGTTPETAGIFYHSTNYPQAFILINKTLVLRCCENLRFPV